ncbi:MAG TPA: alkaline phosphatase family protein [Pilimelia sp.]|nr:alkaline phosphatase family protein [Pilimelia sp.]
MSDIEHVVVVMFENRSYDHMLGLLSDDPAYDGVRPGDPEFTNPEDPTQPDRNRVPVTDDATPGIAGDPPHSHASVVEQIGLRWRGTPRMDGFVAAYSRKLAGNEEGRPVVHWERVAGLAAVVVGVAAAALALPWAGPLLAGAAAVVIPVEAAITWAYRRRRTLPAAPWGLIFAVPVAAVLVLGALSALLGRFVGYAGRLLLLAAVLGAAIGVAVVVLRRRVRKPPVGIADSHRIMACMRPFAQLPVLATLAANFTVCTRWHCSVPGPTWPNRNFAHAGTSDGTVDIEIGLYSNPTIFHRLHEAGRSWRIYRDRRSLAQVMAFDWLTDEAQLPNWSTMDEFAGDVRQNRLAAYSFIEPCHNGPGSNSQHPGNNDGARRPRPGQLWDFQRGENLVADIYGALRANPEVFDRTLLVITYDEHGGFYDHRPPPTDAIEPEPFGTPRRSWLPAVIGWFVEQPHSRFRFTVLGPRVPAVVVSPRVPRRPEPTVLDHTAIPRTVRTLFAPATASLSAREDASPTLHGLASLDRPRTDLPDLEPLRHRPEPSLGVEALEPEPPPPPPREDDFAHQLAELGQRLRAKLVAGAPEPEARTRRAREPEDVADLFTARVQAARR